MTAAEVGTVALRRPIGADGLPGRTATAVATSLLIACLSSCAYSPQSGTSPAAPAGTPSTAAQLQKVMGPKPGGTVVDGSGGIAGPSAAFEVGYNSLDRGNYSVTAACVGAPQALLTLSQQGSSNSSKMNVSFPCGSPHGEQIYLVVGPVSARVTLPEGTFGSTGARAGIRITKHSP